MKGSAKCDNCVLHLVELSPKVLATMSSFSGFYISPLLNIKNRGELVSPTNPVVHIVKLCEQVCIQ